MEGSKFGFKRLSYDNYETWKRRARQFLTREGLWSYVVEDVPEEKERSAEWVAKNDLALQTIGYIVRMRYSGRLMMLKQPRKLGRCCGIIS